MFTSTANRSFTSASRNPIIDRNQLQRIAPSVFATEPFHAMSDRYRFVPTIEVIDVLADRGFLPVRAVQSRSRIEGKRDFTKHMIRFRSTDFFDSGRALAVGDEIPELVLVNSHDGTSAYQFSLGVYRLVCSNGMVVHSGDLGAISVKHMGSKDFADEVIDASFQVMDSSGKVIESIGNWKGIELPQPARLALANAAKELVPDKPIEPARLLDARRYEDKKTDLWTTVNTIQENLLQGGQRGRSKDTGRRFTTRAVKSVGEDLRLNKALWTLTEQMASIVGA